MKGIELDRLYFDEIIYPMLKKEFTDYLDKIAVGVCGNGSEFYGYDDEISTDHDFEAGVCLFLNEKIDNEIGFRLSRAYSKQVKDFKGVKIEAVNIYAPQKYGVFKINDFYRRLIGYNNPLQTEKEWFYVPEFALCNATNGEVFLDKSGEFTSFRNNLLYSMPIDVRKKKISARLALMAQSGQYNYPRMIKRNDVKGASLCLVEYITHAFYLFFALNNEYTPYYKWRFKKLSEMEIFSEFSDNLEFLITNPNDKENSSKKIEIIENIACKITRVLNEKKMSSLPDTYLETQAFEVNKGINSRFLSSLHIMETGE